jgi:hypothetical protein
MDILTMLTFIHKSICYKIKITVRVFACDEAAEDNPFFPAHAPDNLLMFAPNGLNLVMCRTRQARNR